MFVSPDGVKDVVPRDHEFFTYIKKIARHRFRQTGFRRVTTPSYEKKETVLKALGESSRIATNGLIEFNKKGEDLVLRPDNVIGICRAYHEKKMDKKAQPVELYSVETCFRGDLRREEFHQLSSVVLGESGPALVAQLANMALKIYNDLSISDQLRLEINYIGTHEEQEAFKSDLKDYYYGKERSLCDRCIEDLESNPLRLLSCKNEDCQILAQLAPKIDQYLGKESKKRFKLFKELLDEVNVEYTENLTLMRLHDYYEGIIFEFINDSKNVQQIVGGGGEISLLRDLDPQEDRKEQLKAACFEASLEKLTSIMRLNRVNVPSKDDIHVFVGQLGDAAKKKALPLIEELREAGVKTIGTLGKGSIRTQVELAQKHKVKYALLLGVTEVREGMIIIRDMAKGSQKRVKMDTVVEKVAELIGEDLLDKYKPGELASK